MLVYQIVILFLLCVIIALNFALRDMFKRVKLLMAEIDYMESRLKFIVDRQEGIENLEEAYKEKEADS